VNNGKYARFVAEADVAIVIVADCGVGSPVKVNCGSVGAVEVAGRPEVLIETTPVKPFTGVAVTV
jgi:hypothetical protein